MMKGTGGKQYSSPYFERAKRLGEVTAAILFVLLFSPLFLIISILVKWDSKGPVIFKQIRGGKNGKHFVIYKFRTMSEELPYAGHDSSISLADDRITRVGRVLRKTSLDELPQIFNILKGEMAFVGPRPTWTAQTDAYDERQKKRLLVKPGVTGLAQISGRNKLTWDEKIEIDLVYVEKKTIAFDLYIILQTFITVLKFEGVYHDVPK